MRAQPRITKASDVGAPLIADGEAAKTVEPCQCPLNDPAMPAQSFAAIDAPSGNAGPDGTFPAFTPAAVMVIGLVGVELVGPLAWAATTVAHAWHGVESGCQHHAVVPVGRAQPHPERCAPLVDHKMAFRSRFAAIRWVRAGLGTALFAATAALSRLARLQSRCPASDSCSSSTRWSLAQTPAVCQSRNLRQQVMPEQPNSHGSISQGIPERSTKMMPAKASRSSHRGRPPLGFGRSPGRRGAMASHKSSGTRGLLMVLQRMTSGFVRRSKPTITDSAINLDLCLIIKRAGMHCPALVMVKA